MPRDLKQTDRNELTVQDAISACKLTLYYRQPTTTERIAFNSACWLRIKKKMYNRTVEARAAFGELVLTGIGEGDFACGTDDSGKVLLISSDPKSSDYRPDWKEQVVATAGDLLILLGMTVFEGSLTELIKAAADDEPEEDEDGDEVEVVDAGEDILPLVSSSNG